MDVTISQKSPVLLKAEVNVAWEKVSPIYNQSLNEIRQHAQLPGFRKGKAPLGLIKKRYRQEITDDLARKIVPEDMEAWIGEKEIKAVGQPRLHHVGLKENEHFHYGVFIEVLPEVSLQEWKGIEAEQLNATTTDEQVDQHLEQLIERETKKVTIEDRGIENDDNVALSLTVIDDEAGETLTDIEDYQIIPGAEGAHPTVSSLIAGMKKDDADSKQFQGADDESHFETWAGKKLTAHIEIKDVFRNQKPELNDDFAKTQECNTLEDLKVKTRDNLQENAEAREKAAMQQRVVGKLMEPYTFEVPQSLVVEEARNQVQQQIMPYIQMMGDSFLDDKLLNNMMEAAQPQAQAKIRTDLVLEKIAGELEVDVTDEELDKELENYVEAFKESSVEALKEKYEERGLSENVKLTLKRRKALDAVVEAAKIQLVDSLTEEPEVAGDAVSEEEE